MRYSKPSADDRAGFDYDSTGHVDGPLLQRVVGPGVLRECDVYLCGPKAFMQTLYVAAREAGVARGRIFYEYFDAGLGDLEAYYRLSPAPAEEAKAGTPTQRSTILGSPKTEVKAYWAGLPEEAHKSLPRATSGDSSDNTGENEEIIAEGEPSTAEEDGATQAAVPALALSGGGANDGPVSRESPRPSPRGYLNDSQAAMPQTTPRAVTPPRAVSLPPQTPPSSSSAMSLTGGLDKLKRSLRKRDQVHTPILHVDT